MPPNQHPPPPVTYLVHKKWPPSVVLMLIHRPRRWHNIGTTLGEGFMFAGIIYQSLLEKNKNILNIKYDQ